MPPLVEESAELDFFSIEPDNYGLRDDVGSPETLARTQSRSLSSLGDLKYRDNDENLMVDWPNLTGTENEILERRPQIDDEGCSGTDPVATFSNIEVHLPVSTLTQPKSLFDGFEPPAPETTETKALDALLDVLQSQQLDEGDDFLEFDLQDFSIYIDSTQYSNELRPLQHLNKADRFFFDGTLSRGDTRFYLKRVPFRELPVGHYGADYHSVEDQIWVRSSLNERLKKEIYYKLGAPSVEYARFHTPFLWIVDLAKHVIDYCDHLRSTDRRAVFYDFKSRFSIWVLRKHRKSKSFQKWYDAHGSDDFRGAIVANVAYIWREAFGVDPKSATYHRFWKEIRLLEQYRPNIKFGEEPPDEVDEEPPRNSAQASQTQGISKTTVTPYTYNLFSHMSFGKVLESVALSPEVERRQAAVITGANQRSTPSEPHVSITRRNPRRETFIASIKCGDVISTPPDDAQRTTTEWKLESSVHHKDQHVWYGLVQKIHQTAGGKRSFDVIWLYHPRDTPCAKMKYPWKNELFLSDNCTCHSDMAKVKDDDIISTHAVHWFGDPSTPPAQFFVRQTYMIEEQRWVTLKVEHMKCEGRNASHQQRKFEVGDAVLVQTDSMSLELDNFIIEAFFDEDTEKMARLRKLPRRKLIDSTTPKSPPNELVYSERLVEVDVKSIARRCLVRVFRIGEEIPAPYDRNGVGDAFFITHQELITDDGKIQYAPVNPDSIGLLRQGFNPDRTVRSEKLQGLDLFCGGGNFGRGLEDGGAIEMRWANDIWREAIHTYMANTKPDTCTAFLGSVDDLLRRALLGDRKTPRPGEVHFISGGSPCPGFSLLTCDKTTDKQRKNQSLVASFASYVDLYRPHYGLLENVIQMVQTKHNRDECVFSQLVSAIVGLGYQTQILFMDAWSFGAPQSRSRVFLLFTAPGLRSPKIPIPTHSHPPGIPLRRLGLMSNGQSFSRRERVPTPFRFVSASEAVSDLPDIQDAKVDYCVGFPDHRLSVGYTPLLRKQVTCIPTQPWEMNFSKAYYGGIMDESTRQLFPSDGKSRVKAIARGWGRIHPNNLFPTITTTCGSSDARVGQINHWHQPRPITILEARRAQGFLDHEVLVGTSANQYKIIGNSVARQVALALGLALREAWFGTLLDEKPVPHRTMVAADNRKTTVTPTTITNSIEAGLAATTRLISVDSSSADEHSRYLTEELTPRGTPLTTPATSDASEPAPASAAHLGSRKRSSTLYVEIMTKKRRPAAASATAGSAADELLI